MEAVYVDINLIRISSKRRKGISRHRVDELRQQIESEKNIFPVRLSALGDGTYVVEDGRHRIQAHKEAGYTFVLAIVKNLKSTIQRIIFGIIRKFIKNY